MTYINWRPKHLCIWVLRAACFELTSKTAGTLGSRPAPSACMMVSAGEENFHNLFHWIGRGAGESSFCKCRHLQVWIEPKFIWNSFKILADLFKYHLWWHLHLTACWNLLKQFDINLVEEKEKLAWRNLWVAMYGYSEPEHNRPLLSHDGGIDVTDESEVWGHFWHLYI